MINAIVGGYLVGTLLVAVWLGGSLYRNADEFDWHYRKGDLFLSCTLDIILWPLLLVTRPKTLLKGSAFQPMSNDPLTDLDAKMADRMRKLQHIVDNPPVCGNQVLYKHPGPDETETSIIFNAADIEQHYKGQEPPLYTNAEKWAIVNFIKGSNPDWQQIEPIPEEINFENMAFDLIDAGLGEVECRKCKATYPATDLIRTVPPLHHGWNVATYSCPNGHRLLKHDVMHVMMRRD